MTRETELDEHLQCAKMAEKAFIAMLSGPRGTENTTHLAKEAYTAAKVFINAMNMKEVAIESKHRNQKKVKP